MLTLSRNTRICKYSFHSQNTWRGRIQRIVPARLKHWPSLRPWCRRLIVEHFVLGFGVAKIPFQNVVLASFVACPSFDTIICCCRIAYFLCSASFNHCAPIHIKFVSVVQSLTSGTSLTALHIGGNLRINHVGLTPLLHLPTITLHCNLFTKDFQ